MKKLRRMEKRKEGMLFTVIHTKRLGSSINHLCWLRHDDGLVDNTSNEMPILHMGAEFWIEEEDTVRDRTGIAIQ